MCDALNTEATAGHLLQRVGAAEWHSFTVKENWQRRKGKGASQLEYILPGGWRWRPYLWYSCAAWVVRLKWKMQIFPPNGDSFSHTFHFLPVCHYLLIRSVHPEETCRTVLFSFLSFLSFFVSIYIGVLCGLVASAWIVDDHVWWLPICLSTYHYTLPYHKLNWCSRMFMETLNWNQIHALPHLSVFQRCHHFIYSQER